MPYCVLIRAALTSVKAAGHGFVLRFGEVGVALLDFAFKLLVLSVGNGKLWLHTGCPGSVIGREFTQSADFALKS